MVVAPDAHPVCVVTKAFQVSASDPSEQVGHVGHEPEWCQLFYVGLLLVLPVLHGFDEPLEPRLPLLASQGPNLSRPIAAQYVGEVLSPP